MLVFNEWLKAEMDRRHLSQGALAIRTGLSQSSITSWCRGCSPNMDKAQRIIEALGYEIRIVKKGDRDDMV